MHSSHIQFFNFIDSQNLLEATDRHDTVDIVDLHMYYTIIFPENFKTVYHSLWFYGSPIEQIKCVNDAHFTKSSRIFVHTYSIYNVVKTHSYVCVQNNT